MYLQRVYHRLLFWKAGSRCADLRQQYLCKNYTYLGTVEESEGCRFRIEQKNKFSVGETIEIMKPDGRNVQALVKSICDEEGNAQESAPHPKQILWVELDAPADVHDILRKKAEQ